jgi:hypothetical protein
VLVSWDVVRFLLHFDVVIRNLNCPQVDEQQGHSWFKRAVQNLIFTFQRTCVDVLVLQAVLAVVEPGFSVVCCWSSVYQAHEPRQLLSFAVPGFLKPFGNKCVSSLETSFTWEGKKAVR